MIKEAKSEVNWKTLEEFCERILGTIEVTDQGISDEDPFEFAKIQVIMLAKLETSIKKEDRYALPNLVKKSIYSIAKSRKLEKKDLTFKQSFQFELNRFLKNQIRTYEVLYPLNIDSRFLNVFHSLKIGKQEVHALTWTDASNRLPGLEQFENAINKIYNLKPIEVLLPTKFIPLLAEINSRTVRGVLYKISDSFELLRATMNFVADEGSIHFSPNPTKPMSKYSPPPIIGIFRENGSYINCAWTPLRGDYRTDPFCTAERLQDALSLLNTIMACEEKIKKLLINILIRYTESLDGEDTMPAFLALWQAIEAIALQFNPNHLGSNTICSRICKLICASCTERKLLRVLVYKRNDMVHEGKYSEDLALQTNVLKLIVEKCIESLLNSNGPALSMEILDKFYSESG